MRLESDLAARKMHFTAFERAEESLNDFFSMQNLI
jgi:hypothetical protein